MKINFLPPSFLSSLAPILSGVFFLLAAACGSQAATSASASMSNTPMGGGVFQYTITLDNTGTTPIETFWFAWEPGYDFLATSPTNIVSPSNWTESITGGGPGDGFAIQWVTSSAPLAAGGSLTFTFESTDTPAEIAGKSNFFPRPPVGTSFVYEGAPFVGGSDEFVVGGGPAGPGAPKVTITGSMAISTGKSKITIKGKAAGDVTSVTYRIGSKKAKAATGAAKWHFDAALKKGRNVIVVTAHGPGGASAPAKVTVTRE